MGIHLFFPLFVRVDNYLYFYQASGMSVANILFILAGFWQFLCLVM